jgi:ribonuclease HI
MARTADQNEWDAIVYTDGACIGNPGPGGWGILVIPRNGIAVEKSGYCRYTTNNRMELIAAIEGLRATPPGARVMLRSDSQLLINTLNSGWKRNANRDLWDMLEGERAARAVVFEWVKGHCLDPHNARVDELATRAAKLALEQGAIERAGSGSRKVPTKAAPRILPKGRPQGDSTPSPLSAVQNEAFEGIHSMLREGEAIARCTQCGREFVSRVATPPETVCSLASCQFAARRHGRFSQ